MAHLTSRERVTRMFARHDQDRIPRYDSYWPDTIGRWQSEGLDGGDQAVLDLLQTDFHSVGTAWPAPFPGQRILIGETEETWTFKDHWGATLREWKYKSGTPEHIGFDCDTPEKWETIYKPAYLSAPVQIDLDDVKRRYAEGRQTDRWILWHTAESFELTRRIMGDEIVMMAMMTDPDWVRDVSQTYTDLQLREFEAIMSLGLDIDGVFMWGDMAYNRATFCSPKMYRDLIWPDHKRVADWVHDHGMEIIYHTDGNVNGVIDLYLEAGFDCLQPLEAKAGMDIRHLCPAYGDRLAFMGNIDIMQMMDNDLDRIEAEIAAKFAAGMATRGYAYHSDHSIPPQVSWATYQALIRLIDQHGRYA